MKRTDLDWPKTFESWSNYDPDDLEREIRDEKMRRAAHNTKLFQRGEVAAIQKVVVLFL
ncbi:MAG: hypothetical protein ACYDG4_15230 [Desulfuromonadaceae bacterium]